MAELKARYAVFAKTGGPFIRTGFMRGEQQWLLDLAADPRMATELVMRTARHLTAIGLEELRRWDLYDTGVWIFDDMAATKGPLFSPATAERILAPAWELMVSSFRSRAPPVILQRRQYRAHRPARLGLRRDQSRGAIRPAPVELARVTVTAWRCLGAWITR